MDRMGIVVPAYEGTRELDFTTVSPEELSLDLETAQAMGCVLLYGQGGRILQSETQHLAIHPDTGGLTLWRNGLVEVDPEPDDDDTSLTSTMQVFATTRIDGLTYRGFYARTGRLPLLSRLLSRRQHRYGSAEDIRRGDQVALEDPAGNRYRSHTVTSVELPNS